MPQVWYRPAASTWNVSPPLTGPGVSGIPKKRFPSPSCPYESSPQQYATPGAVRPQVWAPPAESDWNVSPPLTGTGLSRLAFVPSPSAPFSLLPQQYATPALVRPQT